MRLVQQALQQIIQVVSWARHNLQRRFLSVSGESKKQEEKTAFQHDPEVFEADV